MNGSVEVLLAELKSGLRGLYSQRLRGVYLYGSYARGEGERESDVDVLIVLDRLDSYGAEVDRTSKLVSNVSLKYGVSVSRVFVPEREWQKGEGLFLANIRRESIPA
jgi:predicted nucleotidyltransferase